MRTEILRRVGAKELQFYFLTGDGIEEYGPDRVFLAFSGTPAYLPQDLRAYMDRERTGLAERERRGEIYNGIGYRLNDFRSAADGWFLDLSPVDYFSFLLTNLRAYETVLRSERDNTPVSIVEKYVADVTDLRSSVLANKLGSGVTLITSNDKVMLGRRTPKAVQYPGVVHCSFGEAFEVPDRDPFDTFVRGAMEELGLAIERHDIAFLAAGITVKNLQPTLFGKIETKLTDREVLERWRCAEGRDEAEVFFLDFNPLELSRAMRRMRFADVAETMAIFALVNKFGLPEVASYFP